MDRTVTCIQNIDICAEKMSLFFGGSYFCRPTKSVRIKFVPDYLESRKPTITAHLSLTHSLHENQKKKIVQKWFPLQHQVLLWSWEVGVWEWLSFKEVQEWKKKKKSFFLAWAFFICCLDKKRNKPWLVNYALPVRDIYTQRKLVFWQRFLLYRLLTGTHSQCTQCITPNGGPKSGCQTSSSSYLWSAKRHSEKKTRKAMSKPFKQSLNQDNPL